MVCHITKSKCHQIRQLRNTAKQHTICINQLPINYTTQTLRYHHTNYTSPSESAHSIIIECQKTNKSNQFLKTNILLAITKTQEMSKCSNEPVRTTHLSNIRRPRMLPELINTDKWIIFPNPSPRTKYSQSEYATKFHITQQTTIKTKS